MQKLINKNLSFIDNTTQITLSLQNSWYKNWWIINRNENEDYNIVPKLKPRLNNLENIFWPCPSSKPAKQRTNTSQNVSVSQIVQFGQLANNTMFSLDSANCHHTLVLVQNQGQHKIRAAADQTWAHTRGSSFSIWEHTAQVC